ncbi:MAG: hypothetical protein E7307_01560 [Butyrivibrio sp.]|nr:hypothetical protein [Butyrivibrio sp.]
MFFNEAIEDTYDEAMKPYYESEERTALDSIATNKYEQLLSSLPENLQKELTDFRQAMVDLMASESCNAYVTGVTIGMSTKK